MGTVSLSSWGVVDVLECDRKSDYHASYRHFVTVGSTSLQIPDILPFPHISANINLFSIKNKK